MRGEIVWYYAYDVAFEAAMPKVREALAGLSEYRKPGRYRKVPESISTFMPLVRELAPRPLPEGRVPEGLPKLREVSTRLKLFSVGAVSAEVRMPFEVGAIDDLIALRELGEDSDGPVRKLAVELVGDFVESIACGLVRPTGELGRCEMYTVLCITEADGLSEGTASWLAATRAQVAAFLLGERNAVKLSAGQIDETVRMSYSYTNADLAVVDWEAMLLVDTATEYDELLYMAEVANLQMAELRVHDEALDRAVDRAYDDLERHRKSPSLFRPSAKLAHGLRQEMMDLAHMSDEILNLSKHFGDWYLARIYMALRTRFHLTEWETQLERKLKTVSTMYELIARNTTDRTMVVLETIIVLLFVVDVAIMLFMGGK
jgi:hypothetical protein